MWRYVVAILLPWVSFFTINQPMYGIICLILQCTVIGWPFAAIWALLVVNNYEEKHEEKDG